MAICHSYLRDVDFHKERVVPDHGDDYDDDWMRLLSRRILRYKCTCRNAWTRWYLCGVQHSTIPIPTCSSYYHSLEKEELSLPSQHSIALREKTDSDFRWRHNLMHEVSDASE